MIFPQNRRCILRKAASFFLYLSWMLAPICLGGCDQQDNTTPVEKTGGESNNIGHYLGPCAVCTAILLFFIAIAAWTTARHHRLAREAAEIKENHQRFENADLVHRQIERQKNDAREKRQLLAQVEDAMEQVRREERLQIAKAQRKLKKMADSFQTGDDIEAVDNMLRRLILQGACCGKVVSIKYMASPTGRVSIEWVVHGPFTRETKVIVRLNGVEVHTDCSVEGRWTTQLRRGQRHKFTFEVQGGQKTLKDDAVTSIRIPTEKEWKRRAVAPMKGLDDEFSKFSERQRTYLRLQEAANMDIANSNLDEEGKEQWRANVEAFVLKLREKDEGEDE